MGWCGCAGGWREERIVVFGLLGLLALAMAGGLGTAVRLWDQIEVLM
jgi:hypothetical protein